MLRRIFDWVLTINLILLLALCIFLWWTGRLAISLDAPVTGAPAEQIDPRTEQLFITTLRDEVDRELGEPENGYTPQQFLAVFPGLVATDFEDVDASIGKYVVVEGQLIHVIPPDTVTHSAAAAITSRGLVTLLENIAVRAGIDLAQSGTITDIMRTISQQ
jgi:hypothetical protein